MSVKKKPSKILKRYNPHKGLEKAEMANSLGPQWQMNVSNSSYVWSSRTERLNVLRSGLPYDAFEVISNRAGLSIKKILALFEIPQTTYNKKKREKGLLNNRDSEMVLVLTELMDFGTEVFDNDLEKFQRWLKKPNISLGNVSPESLFDSLTGVQEVKNALNRLEYGNLA
ncbi:MAG: antitoxin Xre/MbcA/ParS toxin-binding domain-containing protein [Leeuwenhoekiella sp.]